MNTDRNLLFALVAHEESLLDAAHFVEACQVWATSQRPMPDLLVERGWVTPVDRARLDRLVEARSGAAAAADEVRRALAALQDSESGAAESTPAEGAVPRTVLYPPGHAPGAGAAPAMAGRAVLLDEIGRGGMGVVLRGHDPSLGRELAVKVLREDYRGHAGMVRRFLDEAQIAGQLEHPGVPPVHELGLLPDGRPYFTMRLVRGRTLADLLAERKSPRDDLPRFLAVFEQVAQTLAHAHSRGVIHRDLKPANVMVGAFGEVQVMDWGLAKVLARRDEASTPPPGAAPAVCLGGDDDRSRAGTVLGTPAFMAPEQARGDIERLDARADVFGLGAILCAVLTGRPPYEGKSGADVQRLAAAGDVSGALARLDGCGADPELAGLCKACLAARPEDRPRDGGAVARRVAAYQAGVSERLRRAELERAAAQAKAVEERKRRRVTVGLAAAVLLLAAGAVAAAAYYQRQRAEQGRDVAAMLETVAGLRRGARWQEAQDVLERARARAAGADDLSRQVGQAQDDLKLAARLYDVRARVNALALGGGRGDSRPTDEAYAAALAEAGLARDGDEPSAVAERVRGSALRAELTAALDDWAASTTDPARVVWLLEAARLADPGELRERFCSPAAWRDRETLEGLAQEARAEGLPAQFVVALGRALRRRGGDAVPLLAAAQRRHRDDFWITFDLAAALRPANPAAALSHMRAAVALRPDDAVPLNALGVLLCETGSRDEGLAAFWEAVRLDPDSALARNNLAKVLFEKGEKESAVAEWRHALELAPDLPLTLGNLGMALLGTGHADEALALLRKAADLAPDDPGAHYNLGNALKAKGLLTEAAGAYEKVIAGLERLPPELRWWVYNNLGLAREAQGRLDDALAAYRKAAALAPGEWMPRNNIGNVLLARHKTREAIEALQAAQRLGPNESGICFNLANALRAAGRPADAVAQYRKCLELNAADGKAQCNLGLVLLDLNRPDEALAALKEAVRLEPREATAHLSLGKAWEAKGNLVAAADAYRKAAELGPRSALAHYNLGTVLGMQGRIDEALAATRRCLEIEPNHSMAHNNVGHLLNVRGDWEGAVAAFGRALECDPDKNVARFNLGVAYLSRRRYAEAEKAFREVLKRDPAHANAVAALGEAILNQGRFAEAQEATARALERMPRAAPGRDAVAQQLARCERLSALNKKLPDILSGKAQPADVEERLGLAQVCGLSRRPHAAARFYAEAFAARPELGADPTSGLRSAAACVAVLAAAGQGDDAQKLPDAERARLRKQALDWLRADLTACAEQVERGGAAAEGALGLLAHWQSNDDLAGVRDRAALDKLPADERDGWRRLWQDVAALRAKVDGRNGPAAAPGEKNQKNPPPPEQSRSAP